MAEAKLAPNLPDWMLEHANRYITSGGTEGHMYKVTVPQHGEMTVPALLLTTTGRKSGDKFVFPLFLRHGRRQLFHHCLKGRRAPTPRLVSQHSCEPRR
ncbi:hypothetical protein [Bradyrhizobium sp. OAE829]|uniref:hypothetical protein n=1 Tax=Bradyrhizobium sp. OAE829 TaxID=2663807 RepID=UPI00339110FC